ncbi:MAG: ribosome maturation factor RimP [Lachnospiraceae bacterium]|jgi:ribosome maturation factor RimP|nr:ribosome maturation factor RimP [Lachnospiraceae bacterium]MEE3460700.1 ribosome maturation factor RimP [Lachnospiraceae bacterium]
MAVYSEYEKRTEEILKPYLDQKGFILWDISCLKESGDLHLQVFVDKPHGITLNDCEEVNNFLSEALDKDDFIKEPYLLEVSSPGLDRKLKRPQEFKAATGRRVTAHLYQPVEETAIVKGKQKTKKLKEFTGILKSFDDSTVTLDLNGDEEPYIEFPKAIAIQEHNEAAGSPIKDDPEDVSDMPDIEGTDIQEKVRRDTKENIITIDRKNISLIRLTFEM